METTAIRPRDISLAPQGEHVHAFASFFGEFNMDSVARIIVTHLAKPNAWVPFRLRDLFETNGLREHARFRLSDGTLFDGWELLRDNGWLIEGDNDAFTVKQSFIERCMEKSGTKA